MNAMRPSAAIGLVAATFLAVAAAGCTPDTGTPDGDPGSGGAAPAASDAPAVGQQGRDRLPDNFPADLPLPADFSVADASFTAGDAMTQANFLVRGTSAQSVAEVADLYHERLPKAGYEVQRWQPVSPGASHALVYFQSDDYEDCSIQLAEDGDMTTVVISLPLRDS